MCFFVQTFPFSWFYGIMILKQKYFCLKDVSVSGEKNEKALLKDPMPTVNLLKCGDSSLDFTVRVWVNASDYWPVYFRMLDNGKRALDKAGINIPYPQMDVHMK